MYRVLCPVDTDKTRALAQAEAIVAFAEATEELQVDVLYVRESAAMPDVEWVAGGFAEEYLDEMTENIEQYADLPESVDVATEALSDAGIEFAVHETGGNAAEAILTVANEYGSDSIVIGARGRSPIGKVIFGSVAQAVLLDSTVPVTVVPVE